MCCPNFISPGVPRCENCAEPAGELFNCPTCGSEVLVGERQCLQCHYYISADGKRGGDTPVADFDEPGLEGDGYEDQDEFEEEEEEEEQNSDSDEDDESY